MAKTETQTKEKAMPAAQVKQFEAFPEELVTQDLVEEKAVKGFLIDENQLKYMYEEIKFFNKTQYVTLAIYIDTLLGRLKDEHQYRQTDVEAFSVRWGVAPDDFYAEVPKIKKKDWAVTPDIQLTLQLTF